ncbi:hypothetical protein C8Q75DRAFT_309103 [Abortiporus biennis]|nr:hypothetical protein C8Q75DRAFT_309103 [Abortiporus biennis]
MIELKKAGMQNVAVNSMDTATRRDLLHEYQNLTLLTTLKYKHTSKFDCISGWLYHGGMLSHGIFAQFIFRGYQGKGCGFTYSFHQLPGIQREIHPKEWSLDFPLPDHTSVLGPFTMDPTQDLFFTWFYRDANHGVPGIFFAAYSLSTGERHPLASSDLEDIDIFSTLSVFDIEMVTVHDDTIVIFLHLDQSQSSVSIKYRGKECQNVDGEEVILSILNWRTGNTHSVSSFSSSLKSLMTSATLSDPF